MNNTLLWYTARAAGIVSLVFLSAVVVLGLLARMRVEGRGWPRFLTAAVHRDLALLSLVFLSIHIVTAVTDPFTALGLNAAVVPFGSYYRTFWLGLGTLSVELMLAVVVTSLVRRWIGQRAWKAVHWAAYAVWPMAVLHGIGTGTDAFTLWSLAVTIVCVGGVAVALMWRVDYARRDPLREEKRAAAAASTRELVR
ncbi:MAG TPA: ferric reductase-like transmembrane domain-containing protein [Candidatus Dormibacteraeota bacterium]|nr:ferric reductase-like transmembrane domain-containing protein [Candidatus Dormibacteraeota bacterium]